MDLAQAPRVDSELLGADELLAGAALRVEIAVPAPLLAAGAPGKVRLRPLTVIDLQRITRAARESDQLVAALMVRSAVEAPPLSIAQVQAMSIGLLEFLLAQVNRTSGLAMPPAALEQAADAPIARAALVLAQQLGWTPEQIGQLTLGQILLHLQMLQSGATDG
ncbi:MAG: hypothetical protein ABIX46_14700 [Burkholderiaceae bacterium]